MTELKDFTFKLVVHGHYLITYKSPKTGKTWSRTINDMTIVDLTKNEDNPKRKYLEQLKQLVKGRA